jgi:hypothetical protein
MKHCPLVIFWLMYASEILWFTEKTILSYIDYNTTSTLKRSTFFLHELTWDNIYNSTTTSIRCRIILAQHSNVPIFSQKSRLSNIRLTIKLLNERLAVCRAPSGRPLTTSRFSRCIFPINYLLQQDNDTHNK